MIAQFYPTAFSFSLREAGPSVGSPQESRALLPSCFPSPMQWMLISQSVLISQSSIWEQNSSHTHLHPVRSANLYSREMEGEGGRRRWWWWWWIKIDPKAELRTLAKIRLKNWERRRQARKGEKGEEEKEKENGLKRKENRGSIFCIAGFPPHGLRDSPEVLIPRCQEDWVRTQGSFLY